MSCPRMKSAAGMANSPTAVRWRIAALLFAIVVLTFLDRMNMSVAARYIQLDFQFNNSQIGWILSAYVAGYALFQIPGGLLGDRFGPRKLLTFVVTGWSAATALTAAAPWLVGIPLVSPVAAFVLMRLL